MFQRSSSSLTVMFRKAAARFQQLVQSRLVGSKHRRAHHGDGDLVRISACIAGCAFHHFDLRRQLFRSDGEVVVLVGESARQARSFLRTLSLRPMRLIPVGRGRASALKV